MSRLQHLVAVTAALLLPWSQPAAAQDFSNRPVRLMVGFTAGGTTDFVARLLAERLRIALGQNVVVENKPGANGAIAAEYVAKSEPDGTTLFFTTVVAVAINPALRSHLLYDPIKDFVPVGLAVFNSTNVGGERLDESQFGTRARRIGKDEAGQHRRYRPRCHLASWA